MKPENADDSKIDKSQGFFYLQNFIKLESSDFILHENCLETGVRFFHSRVLK